LLNPFYPDPSAAWAHLGKGVALGTDRERFSRKERLIWTRGTKPAIAVIVYKDSSMFDVVVSTVTIGVVDAVQECPPLDIQ